MNMSHHEGTSMTTAPFCAHADANGDAARCACAVPLLTLSESAVLLDVERTALLSMICDPEIDPERD